MAEALNAYAMSFVPDVIEPSVVLRAAVPDDLPGIVALGLEAMEMDPYPGLVISKSRMFEVARDCVSSASHFAWVGVRDGEIVAAVLALVMPMSFYERSQANVVQFYTKVPGEGIKLMRELMRWARGRRSIRSVVFTLEHRADPRIGKLLTRMGLTAELPVYMAVL